MAFVVFTPIMVIQFNFSTHSTAANIKDAVVKTRCPSGGENFTEALLLADRMFQTQGYGSRESSVKITLLISDGFPTYSAAAVTAANALKSTGVTMYTANSQCRSNLDELQQIASQSDYYFTTDNYNSLFDLSGPLPASACPDVQSCPCNNGGTCVSTQLGHRCVCPSMYTGSLCEKDMGQCFNSPCKHGTCIDVTTGDFCCKSGYLGSNCDEEIKECSSTPCQNGGTCVDLVNRFTCQCPPGYTGHMCETEVEACLSQPCENGGTCIERVNGFECECPPRYYGSYCETNICQPYVADLVFVLDSSLSQTKENFQKQLEFVVNFIDHITIGDKYFQVSVVTFSTEAKVEFSLGEFNDNSTLKGAVRRIEFRPGGTNTHEALKAAKGVFESVKGPRPYGNIAKRFAFVLTDGMSSYRTLTKTAADDLKNVVNRVLAIEVSHSELLAVASQDPNSNRKFVYSVENSNALYTVVKDLVKITCKECIWTSSSDIMFLLDTSPLVSVENFQIGLNAITYLFHQTASLETEDNKVRIGLITFGEELRLRRPLNSTQSKTLFLPYLQSIKQCQGLCPQDSINCYQSDFAEVLKYARLEGLGRQNAAQNASTQKIMIVLSQGSLNLTETSQKDIEDLRSSNISIYAVALGRKADIVNLQKVVGDPALVFSVFDNSAIKFLDALTTEFFSSSCDLSNDF